MIKISDIISIAQNAGKEIMAIYNDPKVAGHVDYKSDNSPLTLADEASNKIIMRELQQAFPSIPIISEEGSSIPYEVRKNYATYWLVDPLDGTKEFINRNGDFTVNIALIEKNYPIAGVVFVPVSEITYYAEGGSSMKIVGTTKTPISVNNSHVDRKAVRSKSHPSPEEEVVLKKYKVTDTLSRGSSLKFCAVAEGSADLYYRHGPTMEWDTAAGQAVLEGAGGNVYVGNTPGQRFRYNKADLLNPGFLCLGFPSDQ